MEDDIYEGPRSDAPLGVHITTLGNEVILSGHLHIQAWHPEGERTIYYSLLRDGQALYKRVVNSKFEDGRLEEFVSLSHIDLPEAGGHFYEVDVFVLSPAGEPAYTGQPHFSKRLRAREL